MPVPVHSKKATLARQRRDVYEGRAQKTRGGLRRSDLMVSRSTGKVVSKAASRRSKRLYKSNGLARFQYSK